MVIAKKHKSHNRSHTSADAETVSCCMQTAMQKNSCNQKTCQANDFRILSSLWLVLIFVLFLFRRRYILFRRVLTMLCDSSGQWQFARLSSNLHRSLPSQGIREARVRNQFNVSLYLKSCSYSVNPLEEAISTCILQWVWQFSWKRTGFSLNPKCISRYCTGVDSDRLDGKAHRGRWVSEQQQQMGYQLKKNFIIGPRPTEINPLELKDMSHEHKPTWFRARSLHYNGAVISLTPKKKLPLSLSYKKQVFVLTPQAS